MPKMKLDPEVYDAMLNVIEHNYKMCHQWKNEPTTPGHAQEQLKYLYRVEAFVEFLEIANHGSIGPYDEGQEYTTNLHERILRLIKAAPPKT